MTRPQQREFSLRALLLGLVLSAILSSANAYLGLFVGMTVSASIPAAVISMGLLRAVRGGILENNLVQTAASAGESAAAGAVFTLPALVLLGAWSKFDTLTCALLVCLGGILGVLFTILLRKPLIVDSPLPYPEGVATAHVLRAGHDQGNSGAAVSAMRWLVNSSLLGALLKLIVSGFGWCASVVEGALTTRMGTFYAGASTAPALLSVGYIVGLRPALLIFAGGALNWLVVLPFIAEPSSQVPALDAMWTAWSQKTRYLGVGAMTVGGLGALFSVRQSIAQSVRQAFQALKVSQTNAGMFTLSQDGDLSARLVLGALLVSAFPLTWLFFYLTASIFLGVLLAFLVLVFGFLFSAVAAYMAGLVGSSNNPVSGVTIATILLTSLLLSALGVEAVAGGIVGAAGPAAALLVGTVVCTAAAIGGDNLQDLKAGHMLGASPARQQLMQILGVCAAAVVIGPVLQLLLSTYGFGDPSPDHPHPLRAPQATLMASVSEGVFGGGLPWAYVGAGAALGSCLVVLDEWSASRGNWGRFPPLAVALGLYLPWEMTVPVLLGAFVRRGRDAHGPEGAGLLCAAGLITGEALMGICLAALLAFQPEVLHLGPRWESGPLGVGIVVLVMFLLRRASRNSSSDAQ